MRVLIRTDASEQTGLGHLSRCLSLAAALREDGASVTFACAGIPEDLEGAARRQGHAVMRLDAALPAARARPEETPSAAAQQADAGAVLAAVAAERFDWVVVDHYGLAADWQRRMRECGGQILAIDDLANRAHACDVLLDQNLRPHGSNAYDGLLPPGCERLLGPRFALVDPAFAAARAAVGSQARDGVLISFGGSDPASLTLPVLRELIELSPDPLRIDVVAGSLNREAGAIREFAEGRPGVTFHHATRQMAELMARAALYVGAGGSSSWERCCLALPGVVVAVAQNQEAVCGSLGDAGSHVYLGRARDVAPRAIARAAIAVLAATDWRARLADRSAAIVDGLGAGRVSARMLAGQVRLREASESDAEQILEWRNHPAVRRHSGNGDVISLAQHQQWLARVLADPHVHLLIGEDRLGPIGVLRYDLNADVAEVSIYLAPERMGRGAGSMLLAGGEGWLAARHPAVAELSARVRAANHASIRLFEAAGYGASETGYRKRLSGTRPGRE